MSTDPTTFFVTGGTVKPRAEAYVERAADTEFCARLMAGEFCFVLTPRQMGKSSLMARTAVRLREEETRTAIVDLTQITGTEQKGTAEVWYRGVCRRITQELGIKTEFDGWWKARAELAEVQRFFEFLDEFLLVRTDNRKVVVFIDEIDTTLRLSFTDDFFAAIRACYNARATHPQFERLTFALLGVASPSDLIKDPTRTPFNVGRRIELNDFTLDEAMKLAAGFDRDEVTNRRILSRVLYWTGGQPYLTQRLCLEAALRCEERADCDLLDWEREVDALVDEHFCWPEASRGEDNLKYIRDRLREDPQLPAVLREYLNILHGQPVVDRPQSLIHTSLKLAGIVKVDHEGRLRTRNRIYERVFDEPWATKLMSANETSREELEEAFWDDLLQCISEGEVVPVIGPGVVSFGRSDELLYPWLVQRLAAELDPPLIFEKPPHDLQEVVDAQRAKAQPVERIYKRLWRILEDPGLLPGTTLAALAAVEGFQLFISTTFDPLLPRAVESVSPGGRPEERRGASSLRGMGPDLPQEFASLEHRFVYQILGRAQPYRDFAIWDDDILRFLLHLNERLPMLPKLSDALQRSLLLVLGLNFPDWLLRFFLQVVKHRNLSELAGAKVLIVEKLEPTERDRVVAYFSRLTKNLHILALDPLDFIAELHSRWRIKYPTLSDDAYLMKAAHREKHRARGCILVSYASPDLEIARYVVSQLQQAGCLVWFDKEQLRPGDDWAEVVREAVTERCGLFVSLVSDQGAARLEGYNLFVRKLAAERIEKLADSAIFYVLVRIDDGEPLIPENEPQETARIQGVRKAGGHLDSEFIGYLRDKQRENCAAFGYPESSDSAGSAGK